MTETHERLEALTASFVEIDKLYQSPWQDLDVLGPDECRPQLTAAINAVAAASEYFRAVAPNAPRGVFVEIMAALSDLARGSSPRLLERPVGRRGAPRMPPSQDLQMAKLTAVANHLIKKGFRVGDAIRLAASVDGVPESYLANYRKKFRRRPREVQDFHSGLLRYFRENEDLEAADPGCGASGTSLPVWPIKDRRTVRS